MHNPSHQGQYLLIATVFSFAAVRPMAAVIFATAKAAKTIVVKVAVSLAGVANDPRDRAGGTGRASGKKSFLKTCLRGIRIISPATRVRTVDGLASLRTALLTRVPP